MANKVFWFEIPAADIDRAIRFYSQLLGTEMERIEVNKGYPMALLPDGMGGAVVQGDLYRPYDGGVLVYLNVGDQFDEVYARIIPAGGKILMEKMAMGEYGYSAFFQDSEGNRIGLAAAQ